MLLKSKSLLKVFIANVCFIMVFIEKTDAFVQNETEYIAQYDTNIMTTRNPKYPIHPLLLSRISGYEMTGEDISDDDLLSLFEAARWSPSYYNIQPWNFVYAKRNTQRWQQFFDLLYPGNYRLGNNSAVLVIVVSNVYEIYNRKKIKNEYHSYDTSAACLSLSLEASSRWFTAHQMIGFNATAAAILLDIYDNSDYAVQVMISNGKRPPEGDVSVNETLSHRFSLDSFVSEDVFKRREIVKSRISDWTN